MKDKLTFEQECQLIANGRDLPEEKQIEEMAKEERVAELRLFYEYCKYNGCEEKTANDCDNCYFNKVYTKLAILENKIRNGTLKELPEDSVVLSREEYEKLTKELVTEQRAKEIAQEYFGIVRNETVEKFAEKFENGIDKLDTIILEESLENYVSVNAVLEFVDELAKTIKEN